MLSSGFKLYHLCVCVCVCVRVFFFPFSAPSSDLVLEPLDRDHFHEGEANFVKMSSQESLRSSLTL